MQVSCEHTASGAVVTAGGRLTASQAVRLRQVLLEAFAGSRQVELQLHGVQEADLSFLQLLCAAHRTAAAHGVAFLVSGLEYAAPVLCLIREAGAERSEGCLDECVLPAASPAAGDRSADA